MTPEHDAQTAIREPQDLWTADDFAVTYCVANNYRMTPELYFALKAYFHDMERDRQDNGSA